MIHFCDRIFIPIIYKKVEAVVMLKKYFKDESYNIMPCGVVAFQNDSTLKIISANDYYYSTYANGNFESLNICEEDKNIIADLKDKMKWYTNVLFRRDDTLYLYAFD